MAPLLAFVLFAWSLAAQTIPPVTPVPRTQDPANYIELVEETGNKRILHYSPSAARADLRSRIFKVDAGSILLIRIVPENFPADSALSNLLITARLSHGGASTNVEVKGYSVVGQSQASGQSQTAVNSNSVSNVMAQMENLFYVAQLILQEANAPCLDRIQKSAAPLFDEPVREACAADLSKSARLGLIFEKYRAEISSFTAFFTDPRNEFLETYFANQFFGMDLRSVQSVARQFQAASREDAEAMLERTILVYEDIWTDLVSFRPFQPGRAAPRQIQAAIDDYFGETGRRLFNRLKEYLVDGEIVLTDYRSRPGDVLTVDVEAKPAATPNSDNPIGAKLQFQITLDRFGMSAGPSSSLFFLKRAGAPPTLAPVNFAPSPGASFGFVYRYRSYARCAEPAARPLANYVREPGGAWGRLWRGLAPGLAMNVSFLNWDSPADYDPTTGKFTNASPAGLQTGTGVVASLFDNQLQFTYGWNLQAPQSRQYWGVGFGFVEIGKALAGYAGQR